jgi:hypothetical protein
VGDVVSETWGVLTVMEYHDSDDVSFHVLGRGLTKKQAQQLMDAIPAIANSSDRVPARAYIRIMEDHLIEQLEAQAHP